MLHFVAGVDRANNAIGEVIPKGALKLRPIVEGGGKAHLVLDVIGFFVEP